MDALTAATDTAVAISTVGGHFMLDGETYKRAAELGFAGLDFYFAGRGGALGDVCGDVVAAAFTFFEPGHVRTQWETGKTVMPPAQSAKEFAACGDAWAARKVSDDIDCTRLTELAGKVVANANPAGATMFAAWRNVAAPADPKAAAVHAMNQLRELRNGLHGGAVVSTGLTPDKAVWLRSPGMAPIFGWMAEPDLTGAKDVWDAAEAGTNKAIANALSVLDDAELGEFVELANQLHSSV
jgi:hypothetical protein